MPVKKIGKIILIVIGIITFFVLFECTKVTTAIKYEDIDNSRDYIICKRIETTSSRFSVIYDSKNLGKINSVNFKSFFEQLFKFNGYFNDHFSSFLNTYVIYGKFDYDEKTHEVLISDYKIRPIYPVRRFSNTNGNEYLPDNYIYRFECSWIVYLLPEGVQDFFRVFALKLTKNVNLLF